MIPAIDLRGGRVVRLEQGDYARETVYAEDPAQAAAELVAAGAPRLHVVDLDGARVGRTCNEPALRRILGAAGGVPVQLGGGIRSMERIETLLGLGLQRVILGTVAVESPELLQQAAERFPGRIVLALDTRSGRVAVRGWLESSAVPVEAVLASASGLPLAAVLHTDIGRDGMMQGPAIEASVRLARMTRLPVIASGGVRSVQDLVALERSGVIAGAIVGRALYSGAIDLAEALREVARC